MWISETDRLMLKGIMVKLLDSTIIGNYSDDELNLINKLQATSDDEIVKEEYYERLRASTRDNMIRNMDRGSLRYYSGG